MIISKYGSLEAALKAGRFPGQAERLRLFRKIATMDRRAPVGRIADSEPSWAKAAKLARRWELKQLATRLDVLAAEAR
jgi:DNA polymerase-1